MRKIFKTIVDNQLTTKNQISEKKILAELNQSVQSDDTVFALETKEVDGSGKSNEFSGFIKSYANS